MGTVSQGSNTPSPEWKPFRADNTTSKWVDAGRWGSRKQVRVGIDSNTGDKTVQIVTQNVFQRLLSKAFKDENLKPFQGTVTYQRPVKSDDKIINNNSIDPSEVAHFIREEPSLKKLHDKVYQLSVDLADHQTRLNSSKKGFKKSGGGREAINQYERNNLEKLDEIHDLIKKCKKGKISDIDSLQAQFKKLEKETKDDLIFLQTQMLSNYPRNEVPQSTSKKSNAAASSNTPQTAASSSNTTAAPTSSQTTHTPAGGTSQPTGTNTTSVGTAPRSRHPPPNKPVPPTPTTATSSEKVEFEEEDDEGTSGTSSHKEAPVKTREQLSAEIYNMKKEWSMLYDKQLALEKIRDSLQDKDQKETVQAEINKIKLLIISYDTKVKNAEIELQKLS